jgi:hypothetical protein
MIIIPHIINMPISIEVIFYVFNPVINPIIKMATNAMKNSQFIFLSVL